MNPISELVHKQVETHGKERDKLLPILQGILNKEHYLDDETLLEVAKAMDLSAAEVFGTATFYSFFDTQPRGKYIIRLCKTIVCEMKGKNQILRTLEDMLKIKVGETTRDMRFSILEANCLGMCHEGPAMLINDIPYSKLTPDMVREIIGDYIRNK
jgi:NADH:ubiquinone oxidoreductase subunit E